MFIRKITLQTTCINILKNENNKIQLEHSESIYDKKLRKSFSLYFLKECNVISLMAMM